MLDPVTTCDGQLYERGAIEEWLTKHSTSPNTGERLSSKTLTPSQAIKGAVEQLVFSGCLAPEESREWMLRKAQALLAKGEAGEAQPLLERALVEGEAAAGWHLGRLLIKRAADAGVPEAAADVAKLDGSPVAARSRWLTIDEVREGELVRVLPEDEAEAAFMFHAQRAARSEWPVLEWKQCRLEGPSRWDIFGGITMKITQVDPTDLTVALEVAARMEGREAEMDLFERWSEWWPVAAITRV